MPNPRPLLEEIHQIGAAAGISLNPITPVSALEGCLDLCDLVLVMSVTPGFGGQEFNPVTLEKLRQLREMADPNVLLSVDGGIQHDTISACAPGRSRFIRHRLGIVFPPRLRPIY